jgi:hypothetical protein
MSAETWLLIFGCVFAFVWLVAGPLIKAKRVLDALREYLDGTRRDT